MMTENKLNMLEANDKLDVLKRMINDKINEMKF